MRMLPLLMLTLAGLVALPATAALTIDPTKSSLTPTSGPVETLSGTLKLKLGTPPPLLATTTLDLTNLAATSGGGLSILLDPTLANPAAGVLNPAGAFLVPALFLELDDGVAGFQLTVPNVVGSYGDLPGCPGKVCLETQFDIDTGGPSGIVSVSLFAVPEPGTGSLVAIGLLGLATVRRRIR